MSLKYEPASEPQAFARLAAVYGGTYMLHKTIDRIVYTPAGILLLVLLPYYSRA